VRDKTIDHCKKLANSKKNEIKNMENELKSLEELRKTSTYKEDTSCHFNKNSLRFLWRQESNQFLLLQIYLSCSR
jgi:hypothetical protein